MSSLVNLENFNHQNIIVNKVKQQMQAEGLELQSNGNILTEVNPILPSGTSIYQWAAKATDDSVFFSPDYDTVLLVKVYTWSYCRGFEYDCNTIINIAMEKNKRYPAGYRFNRKRETVKCFVRNKAMLVLNRKSGQRECKRPNCGYQKTKVKLKSQVEKWKKRKL